MNYKEETQEKYQIKLNALIQEMPDFCRTYFIGRESRLSSSTAVMYAYDLNKFFEYLHGNNSYFRNKEIVDYTLDDLACLRSEDIEEFLHWLRHHEVNGKVYSNAQSTLEHYISAISELYSYYIKRQHLSFNPVDAIDREKKKKKKIVHLENDEKERFLVAAEYGTGLSQHQQKFHKKSKKRDTAILALLLDTGLRVSELVGINISDINFEKHAISIIRKGGNQQYVYFSDKVEQVLLDYLDDRHHYSSTNKEALFLSREGGRLTERSVQRLVKKYASSALPDKTDKITPHKLRSTFATDMLHVTSDIKLVSEQLGHANINTTTIYAEHDEERRSAARNLLQENTEMKT